MKLTKTWFHGNGKRSGKNNNPRKNKLTEPSKNPEVNFLRQGLLVNAYKASLPRSSQGCTQKGWYISLTIDGSCNAFWHLASASCDSHDCPSPLSEFTLYANSCKPSCPIVSNAALHKLGLSHDKATDHSSSENQFLDTPYTKAHRYKSVVFDRLSKISRASQSRTSKPMLIASCKAITRSLSVSALKKKSRKEASFVGLVGLL